MKLKRLVVSISALLVSFGAWAQMVIDMDMLTRNQNTNLEMILQDARSGEPIAYATVYLIPQGDTIITNFALSNPKGKVEMDEIIGGKYEVNAEMIGYKPYVKVHNLTGWHNDLGIILMEEDPEYIDAATITALANPVTIKKDTIEYNAAAFHVGENAMLEDLLKKMPGMEVSDDGTVTVNGEAVDKITVGGKTFFNDPAMAVKNLPAKVIDKIKIIDKDKDDAEFTGVSTKSDREKVMDVQLKEEYQKGWFGNAKISGGSTLGKDPDNELLEDVGALFNGNAMSAWYNETDQVTFLANGKNADTPGGSSAILITDEEVDEFAMKKGQTISGQIGANYNTERIKGFVTSSNVNYTYTNKDAKEKSLRTSFQPDGSEINTDGRYEGIGTDNKVGVSFEMEKEDNSKFLFELSPSISFTTRDRSATNSSETSGAGGAMNSSNSATSSHSNILKIGSYLYAGVKDLGKKGRSLTTMSYVDLKNTVGTSIENSETIFAGSSDIRNLNYDNEEDYLELGGNLTYAEPLTEKWTLQARVQADYGNLNNTKLAFNGIDGSANDYYTSWSRNHDITFSERLYAQYKKSDDFSMLFGASVFEENNETNSRAIGIETTVGENEWLLNWAPYAQLNWSKDYTRLYLSYSGYSSTPSGRSIIPVLDISNPVYVSTGNIYLKPSFRQSFSFDLSGSNPKTAFFYQLGTDGSSVSNATVYASWFDANGVRYSIPVNARKPSMSFQVYGSIGASLDEKKRLSFYASPYASISSDVNYQASGTLPGFDKDSFNYGEMMAEFWGDPSGDRFYSGKSGFSESRTTSYRWIVNPRFTYRLDHFSAEVGSIIENFISRYSLDPDANMNTWDITFRGSILFDTRHGFEFGTDARYTTYKGYSYGFGDPKLIWNAKVSKTVKAVVFSLACADILNQNKSLNRSASGEYYQDTYSNVLGRYFLFGISFNFGKMNAKNNGKVQSAMYDMMFN